MTVATALGRVLGCLVIVVAASQGVQTGTHLLGHIGIRTIGLPGTVMIARIVAGPTAGVLRSARTRPELRVLPLCRSPLRSWS